MENKNKIEQQELSIEDIKASLKEYNSIVTKLKTVNIVKKASLKITVDKFKMGREEKRICLWDGVKKACDADAYEDINKLIKLIHQSYNQFKALPSGKYSTHQYITVQASELLHLDPVTAKALLEYCTYPDAPKSDMTDLIFEGHFYGKTNSGKPGNFLINLYPQILVALEAFKKLLHGMHEDIHEHAVMNFDKHYVSAGPGNQKCFYLGVAAHYLQDLTAPHHAGNYPAVPYVDHYFFEKFASQYVYNNPNFKITQSEYDNFKKGIKSGLKNTESFAKEINEMATEYIKYIIKTDFHNKLANNENEALFMDAEIDKFNECLVSGKNEEWEKAIIGAIPLAVYATAYLFETALK